MILYGGGFGGDVLLILGGSGFSILDDRHGIFGVCLLSEWLFEFFAGETLFLCSACSFLQTPSLLRTCLTQFPLVSFSGFESFSPRFFTYLRSAAAAHSSRFPSFGAYCSELLNVVR